MKIKVAYIISQIDKSMAFEWISCYLDKNKIELSFILLNNRQSALEQFLIKKGIAVDRVYFTNKYNFISAFIKTRKILKKGKIDVVHTHLFDGCLIGLLSAKSLGIKKRIHTRHNSTLHHRYFPNAVKYDKLINNLSTDIIAISKVVRKVLIDMEGVNKSKIILLHHGFDFTEIPSDESERLYKLKKKYNNENKHPVIGVISRYIHWKGIQYIIPAFQELLINHPDAKLILANAHGPYSKEIKQKLSNLPRDSYLEIRFEPDVFALYKLFDVFVHTPIDSLSEAFGQVYIEALACQIPSVFTTSGIAHEFIKDRQNALVVNYKNADEIKSAIENILSDTVLQRNLTFNEKNEIANYFNIDNMIKGLENLYLNL